MKLINKTPRGQVSYCPHHKHYHLEFGNILLHLSQDELQELCRYVLGIDYEFYFYKNQHSANIRKLFLYVGAKNLHFTLHLDEFIELRSLLNNKQKYDYVKSSELVDLGLLLN